MWKTLISAGMLAGALAFAGCSGGGGGGGGTGGGGLYGGPPPMNSTPAPSAAPSSSPSPSGGAPTSTGKAGDTSQAQIDGGTALVDATTGLALYTFDNDTTPNQSNCTGGCLSVWPSHAATAGEMATGNFAIFTRADNGTLQWSYKGKPLYTFASDTASNNGTGDGVNGFHIARP